MSSCCLISSVYIREIRKLWDSLIHLNVIHDSQLYNPLFYASLGSDGLLTYDYAQTLYLGKNDYRLSYISGIVPGAAYSGIALVPGNNIHISGIGALSCSSLTVNGSIASAPSYVAGITPGTAAINKAPVLGTSGEIATITSLTATNIYGAIQTAAQPNITSVGTLSNLTLNTGGTGLFIKNIKFWDGVSTWTIFNHAYFLNILEEEATASGAVVLSSTKDYSYIRDLSITRSFTASTSVSTPTLTCDTISKAGTQTMNATTLNINPTTLQIKGTTLNATGTELNKLAGCTATTAELNYLDLTTRAGTAEASKALVLDSNSSTTTGIASLTSTNLISTTTTQCQIAAGTTFTSTTRASDFNLIVRNQSNTVGAQCGLFTIEGISDMTTYTPSVNLYATRTASAVQCSMADFAISTRSAGNSLSPMTERMKITQQGYVRFGSASSTAKIDIVSSANLLSSGWQSAMRIANDQTTPIEFEVQIANESSAGTNGVAIGTTTSDPLRLMVGNTTQCYINSSGRLAVDLANWSPEGMIHASGAIWSNYGFHCKSYLVSPMYRWANSTTSYPCIGNHVNNVAGIRFATCNGSWVYDGYAPCYGGSYTNASDRRLKTDIEDLSYGLDTVMALRARSFTWISSGQKAIGLIAQEVAPVVPEPVYIPEDGDELNDAGLLCSGWGIDYSCMVSILIKAIQEQQEQINDLKKVVATLQ